MEKIIIKMENNNEYTYYPAINNSGNFESSTLEKSIFTKGSSCSVFLAINDKNERFLIKQYNKGFTIDQEIDRISIDIKNRYNKQSSNYIMKELYSGVDNFGKACKVFEYKNGNILKPYKEEKSIFAEENKEKLFDILLTFASFLNSLKLLHTEIDGAEYYLHNDIKPENVFSLRVNNDRIAQLIDLDSVCSGEFLIDKIESGEFSGDFNFIIPTTSKYYTREDINYLCRLRGGELRRCIRVLDTTAAAKMLCMMLFGRYDHSIPERDVNDYDSNEALQIAINSFLQKGILNNFTERFATVDEMIEEFSAILCEVEDKLPKTVQTAKLLAISEDEYINDRRCFYRKKHNYEDDRLVYIDDLCGEFDEGILPFIQLEAGDDNNLKIRFEELLNKSKDNYVITAEGGGGKTTSLFYAFLKNIRDINNDELYIYIPLSNYRMNDNMLNFISRESRFSFKELSKNNADKIILLLDAFDEINIIRNGNENEKKAFTEKFFNDIKNLKNVRVIISSRMLTGEESKSNFKTSKFLPLEEEQVKSFLKLDKASYENICKNNSLQTLLKNPFMLNIYKEIKDSEKDDIQIHSAADLLDQYFWQMYKSKQIEPELSAVKEDFYALMDFVAESARYDYRGRAYSVPDNLYLDQKKFVEVNYMREKMKCYNSIIELYKNNDNWHIRFSHMLFKEYFIARHLFKLLLNDRYNIKNIDIKVLNRYFSYQTLIFVAQMFASPNINFDKFDAKKHLEDLFKFVVDVVNREQKAGLPWLEGNYFHNLLRIITFFMNGNLNEFDFKKYFSKHEFSKWTFSYCSELKRIILPKDLCGIGDDTFNGCENLISVTIPSSVIHIGYSVFKGCSRLTSINVDENNSAYKSIDGNVYSKDGKTLIRYAAGKIDTRFAIPKGVISIGVWAFSGCSSLTSITMPNNLTSIGIYAFEKCSRLTSIMIPKDITNIDWSMFSGCSSLTNINVDENNTIYKSIDGNLYSKDGKTLIRYAIGKRDTSFAIPNGVTKIEFNAFFDCYSLLNIRIPDSIARIDWGAFWGCRSLTSIAIPNNVTCIDAYAFCYCRNLKSITISDSVTSIGDWAFGECSSLTNVFYKGTKKDFEYIAIDAFRNEDFESATKYFYSEEAPTEEGNYWHYVDGVETIW